MTVETVSESTKTTRLSGRLLSAGQSGGSHHPQMQNERSPREERPSNLWFRARYVLMFLRLALRAFALAGRFPLFAFFSFRCGLAIVFFPVKAAFTAKSVDLNQISVYARTCSEKSVC